MEAYQEFLKSKAVRSSACGFDPGPLGDPMMGFQGDITRWSLRRGKAAIFAGCGMGKTLMQLWWSREVAMRTGGRVLILAPLAVASQTVREGEKFDIRARYLRDDDGEPGVIVTNYEMLSRFDPTAFSGVVLDESSILKAFTGKIRNLVIESFHDTPYRLACTATPAPNDHMELGNHSEFLGEMTRAEMLSMFFVHDGGETQKWRLKGHAKADFWQWVCSWAAMIRKPSDLGYDDGDFELPPMRTHRVVVDAERQKQEGMLFAAEAQTLQERLAARRDSVEDRAKAVADLVNGNDRPWIVWCNLNAEADAAKKMIPGAVNVQGSDSIGIKEKHLLGFADGDFRVLITKPKIAGHGMNWQHCADVAFLGLSDSWEQYYQAVRRCWRFGQAQEVNTHIVTASTEGAVVRNIERKEKDAEKMASEMAALTADAVRGNVRRSEGVTVHNEAESSGDNWRVHLGDCVDVVKKIESGSVDYTIFSPPFASLYTYSDSDRDMGNSKTHDEFYHHFSYLVPELLRVTRPGRLLSFHCMNLPTSKARDGVIGLSDFRGVLIRAFQAAGWIYHSEVCIWKDPVTAMQRTKALGLLHKTIRKDSSMSRQGLPDYLVTMRAPGENTKPIAHTHEEFPVKFWQRYASPVWMDINPSKTLNKMGAREESDERHICPLQIEVIERGIDLWTAEGDLVFSPFTGIGSEGYCAVRKGRRFVGAELKESYYRQAIMNLREASTETCTQLQLFG